MPRNPDTSPSTKRPPFWLRLLLMALLIAVAAAAFYLNFQDVLEQLRE